MAFVKNVNGTSDTKCKCGTWLDHWKNFSKRSVNYCSEKGCLEKTLVGAHVQKHNSSDTSWYIVPLCHKHNMATEKLEIMDTVILVKANKSETCGS